MVEDIKNKNPAERKCDRCNKYYILNARKIPRLSIIKRVDISELKSVEYVSNPDYCFNCMNSIINRLENSNKLRWHIRKF